MESGWRREEQKPVNMRPRYIVFFVAIEFIGSTDWALTRSAKSTDWCHLATKTQRVQAPKEFGPFFEVQKNKTELLVLTP